MLLLLFEHFFGLIEHDSAELPSKAAVQSCSIAALLKKFAKFTGNHLRCSTSFLANWQRKTSIPGVFLSIMPGFPQQSEAYWEPSRTSKMKLSTKTLSAVNYFYIEFHLRSSIGFLIRFCRASLNGCKIERFLVCFLGSFLCYFEQVLTKKSCQSNP